ncbi:MAG: CinA family protein [Mycoplasmataceae bacterium]|jgi:PncC family amidohydrolase|nr:CinA family protein [Mycoplasmataceae bacterium]
MFSVSNQIINLLIQKNLTISTCESVTGGLIASEFTNTPHASKVFLGGIVTYSNKSKTILANVDTKLIESKGAISIVTAQAMAIGIQKKMKTDLAIAITGNAGPITSEDKPIGLAYLSIRIIDKFYDYTLNATSSERNAIRTELAFLALDKLLKLLMSMDRSASKI